MHPSFLSQKRIEIRCFSSNCAFPKSSEVGPSKHVFASVVVAVKKDIGQAGKTDPGKTNKESGTRAGKQTRPRKDGERKANLRDITMPYKETEAI